MHEENAGGSFHNTTLASPSLNPRQLDFALGIIVLLRADPLKTWVLLVFLSESKLEKELGSCLPWEAPVQWPCCKEVKEA